MFMMSKVFLFDVNKLFNYCGNDNIKLLKVIENYYYKRIPKNYLDRKNFFNGSLKGTSYLLNPLGLFNSKTDSAYKVQYLALAGRRDFMLHAEYGISYLDLSFWPDIDLNKLKGNPLIEVKNNQIHFLLEN